MHRARVGLFSLLLPFIFLLTAFTNPVPPQASALLEGRTYDQAHGAGYIDWSGTAGYVQIIHKDGSSLPPGEGGASCASGCLEWVTRLSNGGSASGSFNRDVSYFEAMVGFNPNSAVGSATLQACSAVKTWNLYKSSSSTIGFVSMALTVPAGCRSWSLSASGGFVDFRSIDVTYSAAAPTPTHTLTRTPSVTPSATRTPTLIPTSTRTRTPTIAPTITRTNTSTYTPTNTPTLVITPTFTPTNTPSITPSSTIPSTFTMTNTATQTFTPTSTRTIIPTITSTHTLTHTPTITYTPTSTPTQTPSATPILLPPVITGQVVCDLWGNLGWCRGNEYLKLTASDPQGFDVAVRGNLNGVPFSCGSSCSMPLPEGVGTADYSVTSSSGRRASGWSSWKRDGTPPILDIVLPVLDGRNGWYVSEVDVSANASDVVSGIYSVSGSMDKGTTWNSLPLHLEDGIHPVTFLARDVAGNAAMASDVIYVDTTPPVSQFTSNTGWDVVYGNVRLTGESQDKMSGIASGEISLDGKTWQQVSMGADGIWSFPWNTNALSNGQYRLRMRAMDRAGNPGDAAQITLLVDNGPPNVSITERWWVWESGKLKVSPNHFPIANVRVTISDPHNRWPAVVMKFDPNKVPRSVSWDRHFADGTLAPSGEYRVVAVACDIHDLCGSDTGVIVIPYVATSTVTVTSSPPSTHTLTPQATFTATQMPAIPNPVLVVPSPEISPEPIQPTRSTPFWQLLGLLGLFLAISSASVIDPRPAALNRLRESAKLISGNNAIDSSKHHK